MLKQSMKTMVLAILVAMSATLAAQPQGTDQGTDQRTDNRDSARGERGHRGPPSPEQRVLRMSEMMDLSSDQVTGLLEVFKAAYQETEALKGQARQEILPELCALHLETEEQVAIILSEDQFAQMEQMKTEHEARRRQHSDRKNRMMPCEELEGSSV
jgi:hypothetical protein